MRTTGSLNTSFQAIPTTWISRNCVNGLLMSSRPPGRRRCDLLSDIVLHPKFDPDEVEVIIYDERGHDHRNLVDDSIRATLQNGGKIVKVRKIEDNIGSLLRY